MLTVKVLGAGALVPTRILSPALCRTPLLVSRIRLAQNGIIPVCMPRKYSSLQRPSLLLLLYPPTSLLGVLQRHRMIQSR
jgi:hypothetical protein